MAIGAVWVVAVILLAPLCAGEIRVSKVRMDSSQTIVLDNFGFTQRGHLEMTMRDASYKGPKELDPSRMGFFLSTLDDLSKVLYGITCALDTTLVKPLFTFNNLQNNTVNISYQDFDANQYTIAFANCNRETYVSMDVTTAAYNLEGGGNGTKDYLSVGETELPKLYFCMYLIYLVLSGIWISVVVKRRATAYRIHVLMIALVCLKALSLICEGEEKSSISRTGTAPAWNVSVYILSSLEGIMFFTVIFLIGTGWSFLKPYFEGNDKRFLMGVITLQVIANTIAFGIDQSLPWSENWDFGKVMFWFVDVICCMVVLCPILSYNMNLDAASHIDAKAKLDLKLYIIGLFGYLFLTRAVLYLPAFFISYQDAWTNILIGELVTLWFYVFTGYKLQPVENSPCSEDEEPALKMDGDIEL
ncbi:hypothetical protein SUGI_0756330 [Cryptomeria japonica]|uniref:protein CANDIDATE G-PROTEIN COUPLED RECEPTOR 7 n=1 Tax=Cryptomeria japonica TaxID=3369 RepID=UPI0024149138|nr:protein CANDIDATE G-PROTEIN COUPLED RECEPTOR 7 [Cryptomeria japonica]GLJ37289.1 hypothetical protein SUGI_0756330 [Cryptomeria japonica]